MKAKELLELIDKQWATVSDIEQIGGIGTTKASAVKKEIKEQLENEGYKLPYRLVPMEKVVEYYKININYLKKVSKSQK